MQHTAGCQIVIEFADRLFAGTIGVVRGQSVNAVVVLVERRLGIAFVYDALLVIRPCVFVVGLADFSA